MKKTRRSFIKWQTIIQCILLAISDRNCLRRYENGIRQWELTYLASREHLEAEVVIAGSNTNMPW